MALKSVGLSKRHVAQTCQLIAAILGSIEFTIDCGRDMDAAVIRNGDVLGIVAGFLGAWPSALEAMLAYKTKLVKRELVLFLEWGCAWYRCRILLIIMMTLFIYEYEYTVYISRDMEHGQEGRLSPGPYTWFKMEIGPLRHHAAEHGTWEKRRRREVDLADGDPTVLLEAAARLKYLVINKKARVGDNWRDCYKLTHDGLVQMPYSPILSFIPGDSMEFAVPLFQCARVFYSSTMHGSAACRKSPHATDAFYAVFNNSTMIPFITIWPPITNADTYLTGNGSNMSLDFIVAVTISNAEECGRQRWCPTMGIHHVEFALHFECWLGPGDAAINRPRTFPLGPSSSQIPGDTAPGNANEFRTLFGVLGSAHGWSIHPPNSLHFHHFPRIPSILCISSVRNVHMIALDETKQWSVLGLTMRASLFSSKMSGEQPCVDAEDTGNIVYKMRPFGCSTAADPNMYDWAMYGSGWGAVSETNEGGGISARHVDVK
ncbi:hypothetical protein L210DRAFT_3632023 [Boletus edulis BED1]|uniref:Uncharacterized protein n=1 Tax=Boletus edulis BED1 TaxID=1328754 RepID=A0AAD4GCB1_BOLED|nr:hypothetical protein L210DRAFT_3632023 [Boletus edulis BED1]